MIVALAACGGEPASPVPDAPPLVTDAGVNPPRVLAFFRDRLRPASPATNHGP